MKRFTKKTTNLLIASAILAAPLAANAGFLHLEGHVDSPRILAGGEPGLTAPLVAPGTFTGVVSINTRNNGFSGICTGTVISKRHIITAAHCVDNPDGSVVDINQPGNDVRAVFNDGGNWITGSSAESLVTAANVTIHPGYDGFGVCGPDSLPGIGSQCLGDDIAILTLPTDVPEGVEISQFYRGGENIAGDTLFTMVGHGTTGNGIDGDFPGSANFFNKRIGFNIPEIFECDDETQTDTGGWLSSQACSNVYGPETQAEVWRADFDGVDADGVLQDWWCQFGIGCGNGLGNDFGTIFEANIGGGDSGGPSFVFDTASNSFQLIGNNTFGSGDGSFGTTFGGNLYAPYLQWIQASTVNAPVGLAILMLPLMWLGLRRRK